MIKALAFIAGGTLVFASNPLDVVARASIVAFAFWAVQVTVKEFKAGGK